MSDGVGQRHFGVWEGLLLAAVLGGGLLRFQGLSHGLPEIFHPDENLHVTHRLVPMLAGGDHTLYALKNPYGFSNLLYLLHGSGSADTARLVHSARATSAALGAATIWMLYLAGRELFRSRRVGGIAALLLATCFLHVRDSHFGTNDIAATFFLTAAFWQTARGFHNGRWLAFGFAGGLAGIAVGIKYNAALIVIPALLAVMMHRDAPTGRRLGWRTMTALGSLFALMAIAGILLTNPQLPGALHEYRIGVESLRNQAASGPHVGQDLLPAWMLFGRWVPLAIGWPQTLFLPLAILLLARSEPRRLLLLLALPLALLIGAFQISYFMLRFLVPTMPFLALLGGAAVSSVCDRLPLSIPGRAIGVLLPLFLIAQPLASSARLGMVLSRPDTRVQARTWIAANLPEHAGIYIDGYGPTTESDRGSHIGGRAFRIARPSVSMGVRTFVDADIHYFVFSSWVGERFEKYPPTRFFVQREFRRTVRATGQRLAWFTPYRAGVEPPFHLDEIYAPLSPFAHLQPGPVVEIWQVRAPASDALAPSYAIQQSNDLQRVVRKDGVTFDLGRELTGKIETLGTGRRRGDFSLRGWALDRQTGAFDAILVFRQGRFLAAIEHGVARKDVADALQVPRAQSGFSGGWEGWLVGPTSARELRLVALSGNVATILDRPAEAEPGVGRSRSGR